MAKKELYTREEVMEWTIGFIQERINDIKREHCSHSITMAECTNILDEFNVQDMLTKDSAKILLDCLEHYHSEWLDFYQHHFTGLALMNRTHDNLSYYYEAWYYFCRPGTYNLD
ncbi:hypothetical protein [Bacillus phage CP-51]|uniref:Uncharacterized protein n=1 Tax=Bacillus phage CP-51 TaxID=1391188 RepID=A0A068EPE9_9CAUD|nr:hypothetical protein OZ73_gp159 [Bacillus phage CP-51]AID50594.1 hypothetical protein [Bacillus phage CP-51]